MMRDLRGKFARPNVQWVVPAFLAFALALVIALAGSGRVLAGTPVVTTPTPTTTTPRS